MVEQIKPEIEYVYTNEIKIGDIFLHSSNLSTEKLISLAKGILLDKTFKEYLELLKLKRNSSGSYFG